ncbi:M20 family metallopeptidase [Streptomyces hygroscopicus]|uniref:M20 family metallopeptidase n=1 Tax=Streptomyces hygroscopicus TaxID=1912 RepID=UPI0004CB5955|nr:M20 family metallopeptidase [Streptomyces hygroscopicus]
MSAKPLASWTRTHLDDLLADLSALVGLESPSTDKALLDTTAASIRSWVEDRLGPPAEWIRHEQPEHGDVLTATYPGTPGKPVLLICHYDTVWPAGTLAEWPFTVEHGTARGPGVYDMKAGLVTGVWALRALRALGLPHPTVTFVFTGDEELGSPMSRPLIEDAARDCAAALVLEPGVGWDIKTERKGVGTFHLTATGIESHAGNDPAAGASAVHALAELVTRLAAAADPDAGTTINIGTFNGGTARNVVAGRAHCLVDVRVSRQDEADRVDEVLAALRPSDPRVEVRVGGEWNRPAMRLTPASEALFGLADEVATELRGPLEPISVGGGSDANFIAALGVPVLDGLGCSGAGPHARHEHVIVDDIPDRVALVAGLLHRMAAAAV